MRHSTHRIRCCYQPMRAGRDVSSSADPQRGRGWHYALHPGVRRYISPNIACIWRASSKGRMSAKRYAHSVQGGAARRSSWRGRIGLDEAHRL